MERFAFRKVSSVPFNLRILSLKLTLLIRTSYLNLMMNLIPLTSLSRLCLREEMLFFLCLPTTASGYLSLITLLHSLKCWILQLIPFPLISTSPGTYSSHLWSVEETSGSSLPDCIARDSKSLMISTKASFTLVNLENASGVPGCLVEEYYNIHFSCVCVLIRV